MHFAFAKIGSGLQKVRTDNCRKHYTSVLRTTQLWVAQQLNFSTLCCVVFEISFLHPSWFCCNAENFVRMQQLSCTLVALCISFFFRNAPAKFAERPWHFLCEGAERKSNFQCSIRLIFFRTDWKDQLGNKLGSKTSVLAKTLSGFVVKSHHFCENALFPKETHFLKPDKCPI